MEIRLNFKKLYEREVIGLNWTVGKLGHRSHISGHRRYRHSWLAQKIAEKSAEKMRTLVRCRQKKNYKNHDKGGD
jgi:hypothetical protein